jgi:sterol desaturase/sphingolipid hydroxylase (fatty acid hydroxylase superfamily)
MNDRNFEDCKRTLEELESLFYTLFLWIATFFLPWCSVIMILLFFFLLLATSCIHGTLYAFNDILISYKRKYYARSLVLL